MTEGVDEAEAAPSVVVGQTLFANAMATPTCNLAVTGEAMRTCTREPSLSTNAALVLVLSLIHI